MARYLSTAPARTDTVGILLTNLGTPQAPTPAAVRRYLAEFLADPRVVEAPRWLWLPLLHGIILRRRPRRVARAYASIWSEEGSALLAISRRQAAALQAYLQQHDACRVVAAMRYGQPSIASGLHALREQGAGRMIVLPAYPQYSATTTGSVFDAVSQELRRWRWLPELRFITHYHDDDGYIDALASSIEGHWRKQGRGQRLLMSFHGIPEQYARAGDPYAEQCRRTAALLAERLRLGPQHWEVAFQSRFGPTKWLQPYTDERLRALARTGVREVDIICPGFAADCLETLEEISIQNRKVFEAAGGGTLRYISSLNDGPKHIRALGRLIRRHAGGWLDNEAISDDSL